MVFQCLTIYQNKVSPFGYKMEQRIDIHTKEELAGKKVPQGYNVYRIFVSKYY